MKSPIKKISSVILSLMVVFSSMSFIVDEHYCGETLIDFSYFGEANHCGMEEMEMISSENLEIKKRNCCKDSKSVVHTSIFNKEKNFNHKYLDIEIVSTYFYFSPNIFKNLSVDKDYCKDFPPPDIQQNFQILHQTFLI